MKLLKGLFFQHFIPIIGAITLLFIIDFFFSVLYSANPKTVIVNKNTETPGNYYINNQEIGSQFEFVKSLKDSSTLTVLGSSELQELPYIPYKFLTDSIGINTIAFGHAYHQSFSMACEILAAGDALEGANICIILSPGWFQTEGTNSEAFLEFVPQNFLRAIINDSTIPISDLLHIARYVAKEFDNIESPTAELSYFNVLNKSQNFNGFPKSVLNSKFWITDVDYNVKKITKVSKNRVQHSYDWVSAKDRLQKEAILACSNNSIFVNADYYTKYLKSDKPFKKSIVQPFQITDEFKDFELLVAILQRKNCNATFVFQPLNPFYYDDLGNFNEIIEKIQHTLKKANFPLLNLFATSTKDYTPGFLTDIMHPSNRGWMDINEFLANHYYELSK